MFLHLLRGNAFVAFLQCLHDLLMLLDGALALLAVVFLFGRTLAGLVSEQVVEVVVRVLVFARYGGKFEVLIGGARVFFTFELNYG